MVACGPRKKGSKPGSEFACGSAAVSAGFPIAPLLFNADEVHAAMQVADARDGRSRIGSGLAVGERVVLAPPAELVDGAKVVVEN